MYYEEISSITKHKSIRDRIKQINQSRIYVDVENIKKENEYILNENFNRYMSIKEFDDEMLYIDITSDEYLSDLKKILQEMNEKIKVNPCYSQKIIILRGIISKMAEEFLFNEKYGLNTYLSSRIRHGYCKKQLISVFQDYNLLSKKESNDSDDYQINEYWDDFIERNDIHSNNFKQQLSKFTLKIEKKVEEIKSKWLSIKYKEDTDAFLDFSNCVGKCLIIERDNIADFESFFNEVIIYLWDYTEMCFGKLRKRINGELLSFFLNELSNLESEMIKIKNIKIDKYVKQVCVNINLCKSQIGGKINEFSNVFYKRDVYYKDFTMSELIDTCSEITSKLNSHFGEVNLKRNIIEQALFKGETFPYFVDIINILINNAMEHCGFNSYNELTIEITIEREKDKKIVDMIKSELNKKGISSVGDDFLSITVKNNVSNEMNMDKIGDKINSIFSSMKHAESLKKYTQTEVETVA